MIYNAPYSPHYPAQGNTALTDGIRGDWTYGDGSWQGFIDKKRLDVTIDMGTETAVHSVSADFMQVVGAEAFCLNLLLFPFLMMEQTSQN